MRRLVRPVLILVITILPAFANAQGPEFVDLLPSTLVTHSVNEAVEIHVAINPPGKYEEEAMVTHQFVLEGGSPLILNVVEGEAKLVGFGTFTVKHRAAQSEGQASIEVNGQELCCVKQVGNRLTYRIAVQRSKTAYFLSGGEFPIPVADRSTAVLAVSDRATGETRSFDYIVRPVIFADRGEAD